MHEGIIVVEKLSDDLSHYVHRAVSFFMCIIVSMYRTWNPSENAQREKKREERRRNVNKMRIELRLSTHTLSSNTHTHTHRGTLNPYHMSMSRISFRIADHQTETMLYQFCKWIWIFPAECKRRIHYCAPLRSSDKCHQIPRQRYYCMQQTKIFIE